MSSLPGIIHQGELGIFRKGKALYRYFVLFEDHLDYYTCLEDAKPDVTPQGCLALSDVAEIAVVEIADDLGLKMTLGSGSSLQLMVREKPELKPWIEALEPLLGDQDEDDESEEEVLFSSYLSVEVKGQFTKKYFLLFADRIDFTSAEDDEDVEGSILLSTISSSKSSAAGFTIIAGDRRVMFQCNMQDAALWVKQLKEACRAFEEKQKHAGKNPGAVKPSASISPPRTPVIRVVTEGGTVRAPQRYSVEEKFDNSEKPSEIETDLKVAERQISRASVGGEVVFKGVLEIFRKGRVDERFFVLCDSSFEFWNTESDFDAGRPRNGCILAVDIAKLEDTNTGFTVNLIGDDRALQLRCGTASNLTMWLAAWQKVLPASVCEIHEDATADPRPQPHAAPQADHHAAPQADQVEAPERRESEKERRLSEARFWDKLGSSIPQTASQPTRETDGAATTLAVVASLGDDVVFGGLKIEAPEGKVARKTVVKGDLQMERKGTVDKRYFVLFPDRLEYYNSATDHMEGANPRGMVALKDVTGFSAVQNGFEIGLGERSVRLLGKSREEREMWAAGWAEVFNLQPAGSKEAKAEVAAGNPLDLTPVKMMQPDAEMTTGEKMRGPTADSKMPSPQFSDVIHMGTLGIERRGKQGESRHFAIFPTSLQYWNTASDMASGKDARGRIAVRDITRFDSRGTDFEICVFQDRWLTLIPEEGDMQQWASAFAQVGLPNPDEEPLNGPQSKEESRPAQPESKELMVSQPLPSGPSAAVAKEEAVSAQLLEQKNGVATARAAGSGSSAHEVITLQLPQLGNFVSTDPEVLETHPVLMELPDMLFEGAIGFLTSQSRGGPTSAKPQQRHLVVFRDRLDLFTDARASRSTRPLESMVKDDLEAIDMVEDGFDVIVAGQRPLRFRVLPGVAPSLEEWSDGLAAFLEEEQQEAGQQLQHQQQSREQQQEDKSTEGDGVLWQSLLEVSTDGSDPEVAYCVLSREAFMIFQDEQDFGKREPVESFPLSKIVDLEVVRLGFGLILDQGQSIMMQTGSQPGLLDAWLQNWKKVLNINAMAAGRPIPIPSERHALLKKPVTSLQGQQNSQAVLHQGLLEVEKGHQVDLRYIVLHQDRLDSYPSRALFKSGNCRPKSSWNFNAIQEIQQITQGFYILHADASVRFHAPSMADFEGWRDALRELFYLDGNHDNSVDNVIHQGSLAITVEGMLKRHHFVLHPDRIDYYTQKEDLEMQGQISISAVRGFKILDDRFVLRLDNGELELRVMNPKRDMSHWLTAFRSVFSGQQPQAVARSLQAGSGTPHVQRQNGQGDGHAQSPPYAQSPPPPRQPLVQENVPMHQGPLGIQHAGRLVRKFFVLYPDRLDYFDTAVEAVSGETPLGRMALSEVMSHEVFGAGLILNVCGRKVGLKPDHDADLMEWDGMLKLAMSTTRPEGFAAKQTAQMPQKGTRARTVSPRKQMGYPQSEDGPGGAARQQSPKVPRGQSRSPSPSKGQRGKIERKPEGSKAPFFEFIAPGSIIRGCWKTSWGTCPHPGHADIKAHTDSEGWVHIQKQNKHKQQGGRPFARDDIAPNVSERKVALKTVVPDAFVYNHPVSPKINEKTIRLPSSPVDYHPEAIAAKITCPHEESRRSIRTFEKEKSKRHAFPNKITGHSTYGSYPNYITTKDRTYVRCKSPDKHAASLCEKSMDKITNSAAAGSPTMNFFSGR